MKKALCFMGGILTVAALSGSTAFSVPVLAQTTETAVTQTVDQQAAIKAVRIAVVGIPQDNSTEHRLSLGCAMLLEAQVEREDGSVQKADDDAVTWSVKKKDGSSSAAVLLEQTAGNVLYAPFGQAEDLIVTAKVGDFTAEHEVTTFSDAKLHGDRFFYFDIGKGNPTEVIVDEPKEIWNAEKKSYQIVLPKVSDPKIGIQGTGKRFLGWKEDATGKVYKGGKTIERAYEGKTFVSFTAQWKEPQKGETFVSGEAKYKVTSDKKGKKEVTFVNLYIQEQCIHPYTIPNTVTYNGIKYKVTGIAAHALERNGLNKITIGQNVTKISAKAFANCKYLKKIVIRSEKLKASGLNKNAFAGISKNVTIQCPKGKGYTKLLRKAGLNKKVTVKEV